MAQFVFAQIFSFSSPVDDEAMMNELGAEQMSRSKLKKMITARVDIISLMMTGCVKDIWATLGGDIIIIINFHLTWS